MKRLLAKPAPISSSHFSATSGSESEAASSRSHTHTRRNDASSSSPPRRGAMSDGEERLHDREKIFVGAASLEFDMNAEVLDQNVVSMGHWVGPQSDRYFESVLSPVPSPGEPKEKEKEKEKGKEKEKEKRPRNVLRRRPSANKSASHTQSPQPQPASPPSTSASGAQQPIIPPQSPFSPLIMSSFFPASHEQNTVQPQSSAKPHALGQSSHSHHHQQLNTMSTSLRRSISASAAMPHSTTRSSGNKTTQLELSNTIVPQSVSPGRTAIHSSSLHPPLPYASSRPTGGSSRGSSPARSPNVSTLGPGTPSLMKTTEALRRPPSPHVVFPSEREREWGGESLRAGDKEKEKGRVPAVTPAASLIEAYKRQEREREAIERMKERQFQLLKEDKGSNDSKEGDGSTPTTGTNTPTPTNKVLLHGGARSKSTPSSRRNSLSTPVMSIFGDGINVGDQKRSNPSAEKVIDGVELERKIGSGSGSGSGSIGSLSAGSHNIDYDRPAVVVAGRSDQVHSLGGAGKRLDAIAADTAVSTVSSTPRMEDTPNPLKAPKPISSGPPVVRRGLEDINVKPAPRPPLQTSSDGEEIVTPYYTVFGSTSGRIVAVGSPDDSKWNTYNQGYWDSTILGQRPAISTDFADMDKGKAKESLGRSLSRKVSGRWKKQGGLVVGPLDREDGSREGHLLTRSSMQERRKGGSTTRGDESEEEKRMRMRNRRSLRLSIDKFSDVVGKEFDERLVLPPRLTTSGSRSPGVKSDGDADHGTRLSKAKKADGGSPTGSGGNRFWKLMRRISVGGLREKYHDVEPPPPVPALPRDLQHLHPSRSNDSSLTRQRSAIPKKPASASSSPSSGTPIVPVPPKSRTLPPSPPGPNHPRPSTTTRSSSPVSSDVGSSKFFHRNHSAHSSTSSFAEDTNPPPLPKPPQFAQHIIDPSELGKAAEEGARSSTITQPPRNIPIPNQRMDEDWSIVRSPSVELPSLPLPPPRRPAINLNSLGGKVAELDRPESPTIPSFSTNDAVNAFPSRRVSATLSARSRNSPNSTHSSPLTTIAQSSSLPTSLPPRSLRSTQRPIPELVAQQPPIVVIDIPAGRRSEPHARLQHNRRSSGGLSSTSTARPMRRRSSSIGGISSGHQSISPPGSAIDTMFTFRELDDSAGPRKYALTEAEKAEKWDDLMERSARAGGTLHLAAGARVLASDKLK
jgi:hypothetical protein